jgi:type IV pilus assembly protein PilN
VINVNLLPKEERFEETRPLAPPRTQFLVPLIAAVALLVPTGVLFARQEVKLQALRRDIQLAEQESASLKPRVTRVQELEQKRADLMRRLDLVRQLNGERGMAVHLMEELSAQVPGNLWFTKLASSGPGAIKLEGMTFTPLILADLMRRLEESRLYRDVDLTIAERTQIGDQKVVRFTITASLDREP